MVLDIFICMIDHLLTDPIIRIITDTITQEQDITDITVVIHM